MSAAHLRELLASEKSLLVPGVYNAFVAKIFEKRGFKALYTGGYAAAAANYALPDIGLMTGDEMAAHVARISIGSTLPIIADADNGYGDVVNVVRTVQEFERAGAAAVQIEDQVFPKRCGHMEGKKVISCEDMVSKVHAALEARRNPDTVIIARTDAIAVTGLDDAIQRMRAYVEAGADVIFPDAPRSEEELRRIAEEVEADLVVNITEHGKTPMFSAEDLETLGYSIILYPTTTLFAAAHSALEVADALLSKGTTEEMLDHLMPFADVNEVLELGEWQREEDKALDRETGGTIS